MKDFVPKGTGNSRFMKSSIPAGTTWEQALAMLQNGTFPFDLNGINSAGVAQMGDALNKANLLPDAVGALYGLGADAVPSDVLAWLGKYNQHWWKKSHSRLKTSNVGTKNVIDFSGVPGNDVYATIKYSRRAKIVNGEIQLSGSIQSVNVGYRSINSGSVISSILKGRYFYISYIYSSATSDFTTDKVYRTDGDLAIGEAYEVTLTSVYDVYIDSISDGFVQSSDRSAYPDSGEQDGYGYQYLGIPFENAAFSNAKIAASSYTGTGKYGQSNPNSLSFEFAPKLVFVYNAVSGFRIDTTSNFRGCFIWAVYATETNGYSTDRKINISADGNTLEWYNSYDADYQCNGNKVKYGYVAIG